MEALLERVRGKCRSDYSLANMTWLKVGGKAKMFFVPADIDDLSTFLQQLDSNVPLLVLGNGSNMIIRDGGFDGVVIKLGRGFAAISSYPTNGNDVMLQVGASALNSTVSTYALYHGIGGLEFLSGIPGSIGGGMKMNAGAYGSDFSKITRNVTIISRNGDIVQKQPHELNFTYRNSNIENDQIVVDTVLIGKIDEMKDIQAKMTEIAEKREATQPKVNTAGSTFKNPKDSNIKVWQLLDGVGMRGYSVGGAMFSEKHCNFMINTGGATAADCEELGKIAIQRVKEHFGIVLEWEVKIVGVQSIDH